MDGTLRHMRQDSRRWPGDNELRPLTQRRSVCRVCFGTGLVPYSAKRIEIGEMPMAGPDEVMRGGVALAAGRPMLSEAELERRRGRPWTLRVVKAFEINPHM